MQMKGLKGLKAVAKMTKAAAAMEEEKAKTKSDNAKVIPNLISPNEQTDPKSKKSLNKKRIQAHKKIKSIRQVAHAKIKAQKLKAKGKQEGKIAAKVQKHKSAQLQLID